MKNKFPVLFILLFSICIQAFSQLRPDEPVGVWIQEWISVNGVKPQSYWGGQVLVFHADGEFQTWAPCNVDTCGSPFTNLAGGKWKMKGKGKKIEFSQMHTIPANNLLPIEAHQATVGFDSVAFLEESFVAYNVSYIIRYRKSEHPARRVADDFQYSGLQKHKDNFILVNSKKPKRKLKIAPDATVSLFILQPDAASMTGVKRQSLTGNIISISDSMMSFSASYEYITFSDEENKVTEFTWRGDSARVQRTVRLSEIQSLNYFTRQSKTLSMAGSGLAFGSVLYGFVFSQGTDTLNPISQSNKIGRLIASATGLAAGLFLSNKASKKWRSLNEMAPLRKRWYFQPSAIRSTYGY